MQLCVVHAACTYCTYSVPVTTLVCCPTFNVATSSPDHVGASTVHANHRFYWWYQTARSVSGWEPVCEVDKSASVELAYLLHIGSALFHHPLKSPESSSLCESLRVGDVLDFPQSSFYQGHFRVWYSSHPYGCSHHKAHHTAPTSIDNGTRAHRSTLQAQSGLG